LIIETPYETRSQLSGIALALGSYLCGAAGTMLLDAISRLPTYPKERRIVKQIKQELPRPQSRTNRIPGRTSLADIIRDAYTDDPDPWVRQA